MSRQLQHLLQSHKSGEPLGISSICSANPFVLKAAMSHTLESNSALLIESTSNQVDQFGGYTGMTPSDFVAYVYRIAESCGLERQHIIMGGDHLGPNVWQKESAEMAMRKANDQVTAYALAGFSKIHLDASMRLGDDPGRIADPLPTETIARRAAQLCRTAEAVFSRQGQTGNRPVYVIGTEVPIPGGAQHALDVVEPSRVSDVQETIELSQQAFRDAGVEDAWERVVAVVVQPGVEFGDSSVIAYDRRKASQLSRFIETVPRLVYEAHSTDYQRPEALRELVEDHYAILKVGPWLTFALREAVFALAAIEQEMARLYRGMELSALREVLDTEMVENDRYWQAHYHGSDAEKAFARMFSYSDRIRYYWPAKRVQYALNLLLYNLTHRPAPGSLLSQYMPRQAEAVASGALRNLAEDLILHRIKEVLKIYTHATQVAKPVEELS